MLKLQIIFNITENKDYYNRINPITAYLPKIYSDFTLTLHSSSGIYLPQTQSYNHLYKTQKQPRGLNARQFLLFAVQIDFYAEIFVLFPNGDAGKTVFVKSICLPCNNGWHYEL